MIKFNKKFLLIIILTFLTIIAFLTINKLLLKEHQEKVILNIDGKNYLLLTARTDEERKKGLSGIKKLENADGMVFYFESESMPSFWNKNTYLNLEIIWINNNKIIGRDFLPPENKAGLIIKKAPKPIDKVVEIIR